MKLSVFGIKPRGFTLIELLIVIAIISILISVGLASFRRAQMQSRDRQRQADLNNIAGALEQFYGDNNQYPGAPTDLTTNPTVAQPYLRTLPHDPLDSTANVWDTYDLYGGAQAYCLAVDLEIDPPSTTNCNGNPYEFVVSSQD